MAPSLLDDHLAESSDLSEELEPRVEIPTKIEIHDRKGHEFINGEWIEKNMSAKSARVGIRLAAMLEIFVSERNLGLINAAECGYQIFGAERKRVRKPDVSFIRSGVLPDEKFPNGHLTIAPDFVAEVISPNDTAFDVNQKVVDYLQAGVKLIWVIYPDTRFIDIIRADGTANWISGTGSLSGETIIPGFSITLDSLFAGT